MRREGRQSKEAPPGSEFEGPGRSMSLGQNCEGGRHLGILVRLCQTKYRKESHRDRPKRYP